MKSLTEFESTSNMSGVWSLRQTYFSGPRSSVANAFALVLMHLVLVDGLSYFCLFPQNLRSGADFNVSVTLYKSGCVNLSVELVGVTSGSVLTANTVLVDVNKRPGKLTAIITLAVPSTLSESKYKVQVAGIGALNFSTSSTVMVFPKSLSIFVQTDKALYKPGQQVLFRVIAIYPTMKPYKDWMDIVIYDKDRNRISQWLKQKNNKGVFSGELALSDLTPLGTWTIEVTTEAERTRKTFKVTTYVLPKYEVNVILPPYYLLFINKPQSQPSLYVTVSAKYTYGQPVKGTAKLSAGMYEPLSMDAEIEYPWTRTVALVDGEALVEIKPAELSHIASQGWRQWFKHFNRPIFTQLDEATIVVVAEVTEAVTGVVVAANNTVTCHSDKYNLKFLEITPDTFKTGLLFVGYLELKQQDGSDPVLSDITLPSGGFREIKITATPVRSGWGGWLGASRLNCYAESLKTNASVTPSGFIKFDLKISSNCSLLLEASFSDISTDTTAYTTKYIDPFASRAQLGIQVALITDDTFIKAGDVAQFLVRTTVPPRTLYYIVMSKATILISEMIEDVLTVVHSIYLNVDRHLAQALAPGARLVVWFVAEDSEIISDSIEFHVEGAFANNVSLSFEKGLVEPGTNVSLTIYGSPDSVAYIVAVDRSVLLLKSGNDITQKMVLDDLTKYEPRENDHADDLPIPVSYDWPYSPSARDSIEVFDKSLLTYLTDGYVHRNPDEARDIPEYLLAASPPSRPRSYFPETLLWTNWTIGSEGFGTINVVAPDTMTTWVASAFAVSDKDGLGIAPITSKFTVYRPFFVSMTLPYSVYRGEEFALSITVFSYLESNLKVRVLLKSSNSFKVRLHPKSALSTNFTKDIEVQASEAAAVKVFIVTTEVGHIPIEVWAYSETASDAERRMLLVVPEGIEQQYSTSVLIDHSKGNSHFATTFNVTLPSENLVPDSSSLQITVIGDILGTSLTGLDKLIAMPYGCGEQNMLNLAPNVYILVYLRSTGTLKSDVEDKCKAYMLSGYQRELTFQRDDGSFSAFGNRDSAGSVWLSAFVALTFHQARNDIPVEDAKIAKTLNWIIELQSLNGAFSEPPDGKVINMNMQGGSSKGVTLTAYVLITLLENQNNSAINKILLLKSASSALRFLEQQLSYINDSYSLCIISYALVLAMSSKADLALSKRDARAIVENGLKRWEKFDPVVAKSGSFVPPYSQSVAINIEMTAYALLTYVVQNDVSGALPVAKWLLAQRNSNGGFVSTQDTVMALQALARFASLMPVSSNLFNLSVFARVGLQSHSFSSLTESNKLTLQVWEIKLEPTTTTGPVEMNATGLGVALVQLNVKYNVFKVEENTGFSLTVEKLVQDYESTVIIKTCTRWTRKDRKCGMALETIQLLSGYEFVSVEEANKSKSLIKNIETNSASVSIYYDTLDDTAVCVAVTMRRNILVTMIKKATIKVLEYYNPENFITETYGLD